MEQVPKSMLVDKPMSVVLQREALEEAALTAEVAWVAKMMKLIRKNLVFGTKQAQITVGFLRSSTNGRLFSSADQNYMLHCSTSFPQAWDEVLVLMRDPAKSIDATNIHKNVQCLMIRGSPSEALLRILQVVYVPLMLDNETWQTSVTKDFREDLDKFLATLTESIFEAKGQTLLYIPPLNFSGNVAVLARDKELTQRLESILIRWTRQIKEVVRNQEAFVEDESMGPLAEIDFWRKRNLNLGGIRDQIRHHRVKDMLAILEKFRSAYLGPFMSLSEHIGQEAVVAEQNLKHLITIEDLCKRLSTSKIRDIPPLLPKLLLRIRMIWKLSPYYNTSDKITGLLCKVSNEIISRCSAGIGLEDIFEGDVERSKLALLESIHASDAWKRVYTTMMEVSGRPSLTAPVSGDTRKMADWGTKIIFAPIEAFLQRCHDMLEVCDAQSQFSHNLKLPAFGGARGLELTKALTDSQEIFQKLVNNLRSLSYNLLDVKVTHWHDDFHEFKEGVTDLEVMMQNTMLMGFRHASSLSESIELLEAFKMMACRTPIRICVEKMTEQVFAAFASELAMLKKQFDQLRRRPLMDFSFPQYAGSAIWSLHFDRRLKKPMALLNDAAPYLLEGYEGPDLRIQYNHIVTSIQQFVSSQHAEWSQSVDPNFLKKLERSLLDEAGEGVVVLKFDPTLLTLFHEVHYWSYLGFEVPRLALDFLAANVDLWTLRTNVLLVARDYNKLLGGMDPIMRGLVSDRVLQLDNSVEPGLLKLTWLSSKQELADYLHDVRVKCHVVDATILQIEGSNKRITQYCISISEGWLINLEKKKVYEINDFEAKQAEHRDKSKDRLQRVFNSIKDTISTSYDKCASDSEEVRSKWEEYRRKVEVEMEKALRCSVMKSLQELSKALSSEAKMLNPVFNTLASLEKSSGHVKITPSLQDILDVVQMVAKELVAVISVVPRLRTQSGLLPDGKSAVKLLTPSVSSGTTSSSDKSRERQAAQAGAQKKAADVKQEPTTPTSTIASLKYLPSFYEVIAPDQEEVISVITSAVHSVHEKVQLFLQSWERKFKSVWDQDKDAYIRRYERAKKPLSAFETDIVKYKGLTEDVQAEETITNLRFLRIEAGTLKQSIISHCEAWVIKFTTLLNQIAKTELESIHAYLQSVTEILNLPPENLDMLTATANKWRTVKDECATTEARFAPLEDKYKVLAKFEVLVPEEEKILLETLPAKWEEFNAMLASVEQKLEQAKNNFRDTLSKMVDNFVAEVADARTSFTERMPMSNTITVAEAFKFIEEEKNKVQVFQQRGTDLWAGMSLFGMEKLSNKENLQTLKELELLQNMWGLKKEWQESFDGWKDGLFSELDVPLMESSAQVISKRVFKIGRETKTWGVWTALKETIDAFKTTLPLTVDLRNRAMRKRHWDQLVEHVGQKFDPTSKEFTLATVAELRLDLHAEFICELSVAASKELAIEEAIGKIAEVWATFELDMVEEKGVWRLRGTEELFAQLEENRLALSSMKANRFHIHFAADINKWEKDLSLLSETVEMIVQVQRSWAYLQNIFIGSEDIRKQLPAESAKFDGVNDLFISTINTIGAEKVATKAICKPDLLKTFMDLDKGLEMIKKSLDNYLENKRQQFPRFYFLSNENLLDILGQAKDPRNVQPHLKKCYEGIKKLEMHEPGKDGRRHYEASGIYSPDGEYLPYSTPVVLDTRPEDWLILVELAMQAAVKVHLFQTLEETKTPKKEKWVKENPGQCLISAGQIKWTTDSERALTQMAAGSKGALRKLYKKWISYLNKLTAMTRMKLTKIDRNKVTALITIEVHSRDVIEKLVKVGCASPEEFEWSSQLRFYWENNDVAIKQVLSRFIYGYEYQGNNGRLVVTPLTDRCYITLGAAMFTRRGGNPLGPAGTGKTETVKDFGKALARYVIVFNCSDGVDYKMTGKIFSGVAQTGAWVCLDEFNRIEVEVLSVVATQIASVMSAIKLGLDRFVFEGVEMRLIRSCGIFVTMNPGYAGRSELPENLKAMLRPVSMMLPDFTLIAENMLFSEGFQTAKVLAKKVIAVMELSQRQLSKQDHYDYGLRSFVIPIARAAGSTKRVDPDLPEDVILQRAMRDLIKPKLIYADLPLFNALLSDLFPGLELAPKESEFLRKAIEEDLVSRGLQVVPPFVQKVIQLYDCMLARHGNMLVGRTGSGKTVAWRSLQNAQGRLKDAGHVGDFWEHTSVFIMNSLALSNDEIYGYTSKLTGEWIDGILASIMRRVCPDEALDCKWIMFDGPVDTLWIESMNTLLDDNKILTLLNGERINMPMQVSLLFEVEDLSQASPATVSRAGMIYLNVEDLGWWPYAESWLQRKVAAKVDPVLVATYRRLFERYVDAATKCRLTKCKETVPIDVLNSVVTLCVLIDALIIPENGVSSADGEQYVVFVETWFLFCLTWSIGASVDEEGRSNFDMFMRDFDPRFPATGTVFDYWVDPKKKVLTLWEEKLNPNWKITPGTPFFRIQVPTVDTVRVNFLVKTLVTASRHTLVVGRVGVGKTLIIGTVLVTLPEGLASMVMNFSAQTSSNSLQETIEGRLEKRTRGVFAPPGGKKLVCFLDDLNMPKKSVFGFMPALELLKLWIDNGFWYDRMKQEVKQIKNCQLLCAMAPPGGGRSKISLRVQACFSLLNVTTPNDKQMRRIFGTILLAKLADFEAEVKQMGENLIMVCINVFTTIFSELLPTPSKGHYIFNMRDLAKVIQGLLNGNKDVYHTKVSMLQLFCHECLRVYGDRMWDPVDRQWLWDLLNSKLKDNFNTDWKTVFGQDKFRPLITRCMEPGLDDAKYEQVPGFKELKEVLEDCLKECKNQPGIFGMDLVLFKDAMEHICRIHRVITQPRGHMLLVGVGGSGRKSLTKLASFLGDMKVFQIRITNNYLSSQFHDDLKLLFQQAGLSEFKVPTVFLFDDTQIVQETFLEDINNILSSGEVPNLFNKDDLTMIFDTIRPIAKKAGAGETDDDLFTYFIEKVRESLHVVLCLSPVSQQFQKRLQMFPGLVNCTTIDWFLDWPEDALSEVAVRLMADEQNLGTAEVKSAVCNIFVTIHMSVVNMSAKMFSQVKRKNYVTPTSYLEFAKGYRKLLAEKKQYNRNAADKLKGGLSTLMETREQVAKMQIVCQEKQVVVAQAKKECEEVLVQIVTEKRIVDDQEIKVNAEAAQIEKEAVVCNAIALDCQQDLDKAMPALNAAEAALNVLTKKDLSEVKAYAKPPALVEMTLSAVMTVLKKAATWESAKKELGDSQFLQNLMAYDKDLLDDPLLKKIAKFTKQPEFVPETIGRVSSACKGLCLWVRAMETYGYINKDVMPKKIKLKNAQDNLAKQEASLQKAKNQLAELLAKIQALKDKYDKSIAAKEALQAELDDLSVKLFRAEKLVSGLAGEKERWEASIINFEEGIKKLPGDCLVAAACLSYSGPFASEYRDDLVTGWVAEVIRLAIPSSPGFSFNSFLADAGDVREWNIQGLPADAFSSENGVLVTRSNRWPLMIDPQEQAKKWIKNMEAQHGLEVVDLQSDNMMRVMENALQKGLPVLLQDVYEEVDPALEPILARSYIQRGANFFIRLGDKELDYNFSFKLYITTKLANPHFPPEISTKTSIINFAVKESSLENQLLTLVVQKERPDLDKQRNELIVIVSTGKKTQIKCEDDILRLLATAEGNMLDNLELIATLDTSKETWEKVKESLEVAEITARKIEVASSAYKPCAERAALLYFILIELVLIDPMYQFSLEAYTELFLISIAKSAKSDNINERIKGLNEFHTYAVYKYTTRGLFGKHKLLLSLQICAKILMRIGEITSEEWGFFLKGGIVMDKATQIPNPFPNWINEEIWDNLTEITKIPPFENLLDSLKGDQVKWMDWYKNPEPEEIELPGDWEEKCSELQRMMLLRSFRMDRIIFSCTTYVSNFLGQKFVEPPPLDLGDSYGDSVPSSPLLFILSAGVDPTTGLRQFATLKGMDNDFHAVALGQGQAPVAIKLINNASKSGGWVFLANCQLMTSWLPALEKIISTLEKSKPNPGFRLWLSSVPTDKFPIGILQRSVKMTAEPPKGLRANLLRMYNTVTEESFYKCKKQDRYQKLFFALAYFHSVLLERRKFGNLGLNIPYDFNDTDFEVSDDLLKSYLDEYVETPFEALKFLISQANYGGRVTDELDRRVLSSYLNQFYCKEILTTPNFELSSLLAYHVPDDGTLGSHKEFISTLPAHDRPEAFGQHPNADIAYQLSDSREILATIVGLQAGAETGKKGASKEQSVDAIASELLMQVPEPFNIVEIVKSKSLDPSALHTVLFQEIERYNILLNLIRNHCQDLQKGIQGLVVMSMDLTIIFDAFAAGRVPAQWIKAYPTIKPLGSWTRDLLARITELKLWIEGTYPICYWLAGFTYPADFLTAVLQTTARKNQIPIDTLVWDFTTIYKDEMEITEYPKEGVYVKGLYLEGAGWDKTNDCLTEPKHMELIVPMPIILFKPVVNKKRNLKGLYQCPLFLYPLRTGTRERPSFILFVTVKCGAQESDYWVKRGTALLLALAT
ncbi:dynein axonemal heavy chain [Marchantia polymorpha subsp. ruderalis]